MGAPGGGPEGEGMSDRHETTDPPVYVTQEAKHQPTRDWRAARAARVEVHRAAAERMFMDDARAGTMSAVPHRIAFTAWAGRHIRHIDYAEREAMAFSAVQSGKRRRIQRSLARRG